MINVDTIRGPISVEDLGVTYMHEHVFVVSPDLQRHWPGYGGWDRRSAIEEARHHFQQLHDVYGCDTIVDATVAGLGRDLEAVLEANEASDLNIIAATGYYTWDMLPRAISRMPQESKIEVLTELFTADIEIGMEGTNIRPGVLKCVTDTPGMTEDVEAIIRAVARTSIATRTPIITHADAPTRQGHRQVDILMDEGVDPRTVMIGHCNQNRDVSYLDELAGRGTYLGMDRLGHEVEGVSLQDQLEVLLEAVRQGHADQIMLGHDNMVFVDVVPLERLQKSLPNFPFGYVSQQVVPYLQANGVAVEDIQRMLVGNPRRFFESAQLP